MKIKTKLTLGIGILALLILIFSLVGTYYISALKQDAENILRANYKSLEYCRNMLADMNEYQENSLETFEINLKNQEANITEIGEEVLTHDLRQDFGKYKMNPDDIQLVISIRKTLYQIIDINMEAIQRKNLLAGETATNAVFWIIATGALCLIISIFLLFNLPGKIANPISRLSESIKQIASKNYSERIHLDGSGEFVQLAESFNTMAEKLEEYNNSNLARLMMEKKRIETLINNMPDPVIGLDEQLKIIFANQEAIKISGLDESSMIGHNSLQLAVNNDLIRTLIQDLTDPDNSSGTKQKPIKIYADNKEAYFEKDILHISVTPPGEAVQRLVGHVIILKNVTEYKELDFARTNFIANVSHEFKTPISSIKMSLQLLENEQIGKLNEEQKNLLESIKDDAGRLLKITGELLNMTQVESGNIQLTFLPTDPREILTYAMNATKIQAEQKSIQFEVDCPDNISRVQADIEKTAWVVTNLISNAIRYSYDHSVIYLSVMENNNNIMVSVRDTGQGISSQYKDKVFDRYFRVPGTKKEGTGLGLAISREFIEAQGGRITLESEFGEGSKFTVILKKV